MTSITFIAQLSPMPHIGKLMRAADLCNGVILTGDITRFTVTWKDGEIVDEKRKALAKENLKKAVEGLGYDCYSIAEKN